MPKPVRWIFSSLLALSIVLWLILAILWLISNFNGGSRVLCISTPGATVWRFRLDDPMRVHITRFANWPLSLPPGITVHYVADPSRFPGGMINAPTLDLVHTNRDFASENMSILTGSVVLPENFFNNLPRWDSIVLILRYAAVFPAGMSASPSAYGTRINMYSLSYNWAFEICSVLPLIKIFLIVRKKMRQRIQPKPGICAVCGYDLRATPDRCPECGQVPKIPPKQ